MEITEDRKVIKPNCVVCDTLLQHKTDSNYYYCPVCNSGKTSEIVISEILKKFGQSDKPILEKHFDLQSLAELWSEYYPEDVFVNEPKEVINIRESFKKILKKLRKED